MLVAQLTTACAQSPPLAASAPPRALPMAVPVNENGQPIRAAAAAATGDSASLMRDIDAQIGDAACHDDTQCRSIAIGAKACGGPEIYRAWSTAVSNPDALAALVTRHQRAQRVDLTGSGRVSNCSITPDPGAVCRPRASDGKRVCQPGAQGRANSGPTQ
jgi:hypothetical protein